MGKLLPIPDDLIESISKPGREDRDVRFWKLLKHVTGSTSYKVPKSGEVVVLDLACGVCEEAIVLTSFFSTGIFGIPSRRARLIGIDRHAGDLHTAAIQAVRPLPLENGCMVLPNCEFHVADATNLGRIAHLPAQVDFVLVRHQQSIEFAGMAHDPWPAIFREGLARLKPEGRMLITSFDLPEQEYLAALVAEMTNAEVLLAGKNPHASALIHPTRRAFIDGYIVVLRRLTARP